MARYVDLAASFIILLLMVHLEQLVLHNKRGIVRNFRITEIKFLIESLELIRRKLFKTIKEIRLTTYEDFTRDIRRDAQLVFTLFNFDFSNISHF